MRQYWLLACLCLGLLPGRLAFAVTEYHYKVVQRMSHSREDFVQGLEIRNGILYQGTGRYGESRVQVFDLVSGMLIRQRRLPESLFGEGITVLDDKIVQLTWREGKGLVYQRESLTPIASFDLAGEGWGLTNNGDELIYSDGSAWLYHMSSLNWQVTRKTRVTYKGQPLALINELEWTPEYIFANVLASNLLMMIDEKSGKVIGQVDLSGLLPEHERREGTDVLNGIAVNPANGDIWVTGKNWPWIYRIELIQKTR